MPIRATRCRARAAITNGMWRNGLANHPTNPVSGVKDGWYYDMPAVSVGPRVGFAWDVFGDGKTAVRASGGIFYNFINRGQYLYDGGALISRTRDGPQRHVRRRSRHRGRGHAVRREPAERPTCRAASDRQPATAQQLAQGKLEPEKNYQANVAFQRDIGFNTVAEVAWVTNIGRQVLADEDDQQHPGLRVRERRQPVQPVGRSATTSSGATTRAWAASATDDGRGHPELQRDAGERPASSVARTADGRWPTRSRRAKGVQGWDFATEELGGKAGAPRAVLRTAVGVAGAGPPAHRGRQLQLRDPEPDPERADRQGHPGQLGSLGRDAVHLG